MVNFSKYLYKWSDMTYDNLLVNKDKEKNHNKNE